MSLNQKLHVLNYIKRHGSITPMEALNSFGCMRLASRINELRCEGHAIETRMLSKGGKRWAQYHFPNNIPIQNQVNVYTHG